MNAERIYSAYSVPTECAPTATDMPTNCSLDGDANGGASFGFLVISFAFLLITSSMMLAHSCGWKMKDLKGVPSTNWVGKYAMHRISIWFSMVIMIWAATVMAKSCGVNGFDPQTSDFNKAYVAFFSM